MSTVYDIDINQNATYKISLQLNNSASLPLNIVSWSFSGSIRQQYGDPDPPVVSFTASADVTSSILNLSLTPNQTSLLSQSRYVYDVIAVNYTVSPDEVYRLLQGKVRVHPGVTDAPPTV